MMTSWTDGQTDEWTDGQAGGQNIQTEGQMDVWTDLWLGRARQG